MKSKLAIFICGGVIVYHGAGMCSDCCTSLEECQMMVSAMGSGICCQDTTKISTWDCPDGWTVSDCSATLPTCERANSSAGSDEKGYLATVYGTCEASLATGLCYEYQTGLRCTIDSIGEIGGIGSL